MDVTLCEKCPTSQPPPPAVPLKYPPVQAKPLVNQADTPGCVQRMSIGQDPCSLQQVSPTCLSSDDHLPDSPPRVTQTSIGKFLVPHKEPKDDSYGVHFTEYGGVGDLPVDGEVHMKEPTIPRSHRHFGSGINERYATPKLDDRMLDLMTNRDKAWWVDKPGLNAQYLHCIQKEFTQPQPFDPYFSHKSKFMVFPRGKVYELNSTMERGNVTHEQNRGSEKQLCACGPNNTCCPHKRCTKTLARCQTPYWWHELPYWWYGDGLRQPLPVGSPDDYSYMRLRDEELKGHEPFNLMKTLLLDRAERYIPGQFYCDERRKIQGKGHYKYDKCHPPPPPLTAEQISEKAMAEERETCTERPYSKARCHPEPEDKLVLSAEGMGLGPDGQVCHVCSEIMRRRQDVCSRLEAQKNEQHKQDVLRVGQPFRSAACKLHHQMHPPQKMAPVGHTLMKCFPQMRLSNL